MELNVKIYRRHPIIECNGRKFVTLSCHITLEVFIIPVQIEHEVLRNVETVTLKLINFETGYVILKLSSNGETITGKAWEFC